MNSTELRAMSGRLYLKFLGHLIAYSILAATSRRSGGKKPNIANLYSGTEANGPLTLQEVHLIVCRDGFGYVMVILIDGYLDDFLEI